MNISEQDYELLSAYLDGMLSASERAELEARLETDSDLRSELNALQQTVQLVKSLPELTAPRSYILTPEQALRIRNERVSSPVAAESKILRFVLPVLSAVASMALVLFGLSLLLSSPSSSVGPQSIAGVSTQITAPSVSSRLGEVTPTVAKTFSGTEPSSEIAGASQLTEEVTAELMNEASVPEETALEEIGALTLGESDDGALDQAAPFTSMPYMATAQEESEAVEPTEGIGGLFDSIFQAPSSTSDDADTSTGGAAADAPDASEADEEAAEEAADAAPDASSMVQGTLPPNTVAAPSELAMPLVVTEDVQEFQSTATQAVQRSTVVETETASPTSSSTASETATETATETLAPTVTLLPTAAATATATTAITDVSNASPPSQLIGLVLVGLGLSLGIVTLVIARRVTHT
jgi:hypothetical protein